MTVYRVRHKASGLYYKPGKTNLDEKGKLYPSKATVLSMNKNGYAIPLSVMKNSKTYRKHADKFDGWADCGDYVIEYLTAEEFELVEVGSVE